MLNRLTGRRPPGSIPLGTVLAFWAACSLQAVGEHGFDRYKVILERKPFGDAPPPEADVPPPVDQAESFAKSLRVFSITRPEGEEIQVGMMDTGTQDTFVLRVGETNAGGIKLVSADFDEEEAVVEKGGELALVKLADGSVEALTQNQLAARSATRQTARAVNPSSTYMDRRRQRQVDRQERLRQIAEEREAALAARPKFSPEELRSHLKDYNMEVIRKGLPPLPIELTPEQDKQLVAEGILPPMAGQPVPVYDAPPDVQDALNQLGDVPLDQLSAEQLQALEQLGVFE